MKNLCAVGLLVACILAFQSITAQQPVTQKPVLNTKAYTLTQLPQKLPCNVTALQKLSLRARLENVTMPFGDFEFTGQVIDKVQRSAGVLSMNIRSTNIPGAMFTISVITDANNTQKMVGRIINPKSDEVLVLTEENNQYFLVKQPREFFMTE